MADTAKYARLELRRGLRRQEAAAYIGVSPNTFERLVNDGRMPKAKRIYSRLVWDRYELDSAFEMLESGDDEANPVDHIDRI
ncbi:MAG: helix-turn-helix transcriptional regulator [Glycocaulis sp.]